jgi:hypothetical protein
LFKAVEPYLLRSTFPLRLCLNSGPRSEKYPYRSVNGSTRSALALKV